AVGGVSSPAMSILLGHGDGSFTSISPVPLGAAPRAVVSADFNADGKPDLAALMSSVGAIGVLIGQGNGSFAVSSLPVNVLAKSLAVGDFDADGHLDLVATRPIDNTVDVRLGAGNGTFGPVTLYGSGFVPDELAPGDFNLDGKLDLVVLTHSNGVGHAAIFVPGEVPSAWTKIGYAVPGSQGVPSLHGTGTLGGDSLDALHLVGAHGSAPAALFVGFSQALLPFKGGTMVPMPSLLIPLATGPAGMLELPFAMPPVVPSGILLSLQVWIADPAAVAGFAATNGLVGVTP
ncbi:MAG TPA: VCBS repeat-containing protein, partial [Planctomycetota bacterium]|nr:VCBS repeat-containing protein [Planctomycetota bacterium]